MKRAITLAVGALAVSVAIPAIAPASHKPDHNPGGGGGGGQAGQLTIAAAPNPVVFGGTVTITGQLKGNTAANQAIELQEKPAPCSSTVAFAAVATTTTRADGTYTILRQPTVNTCYRVVTKTTPPEVSATVTVAVRISLSIRLSDTTPRRGALVRFSGLAKPAHDGRAVLIQRRLSTGAFRTIARTTLRDAGDTASRYSRRVRIYTTGTYRTAVLADGDHAEGLSRRRAIRVH